MQAASDRGHTGPERAVRSDLGAGSSAIAAFFGKEGVAGIFSAVDALDLTMTQVRVLHHAAEADPELSGKEAAESVVMSMAAVSRAVDSLVRRGYLERREDLVDRRMKGITECGRRAIRYSEAVHRDMIDRFVEALPSAERERLAAALAPLMERPEIASRLSRPQSGA
ncbi:MarR family winged helix-turn-helix transcriptional regulator [Streptomyces scabiei]|uniref:MarR family winged helix-turn-helix transcriptional regulator n=1 Tax=Streptomyces scabiei TaxID=1930 RepID=UPI0029A6978B|nr:MarR family transcriptional regulator [Streptomyces scabiei]MDX3026892.1 MarR family transcriptional regulator [Streptomyces scabiei]MDX3205932.1 MarR family transcriptional regulator [Streptomyces scabiei]